MRSAPPTYPSIRINSIGIGISIAGRRLYGLIVDRASTGGWSYYRLQAPDGFQSEGVPLA